MKVILQDKNVYILRFDTDEDVVKEIGKFCSEESIDAASFSAIGAAKQVALSYYNLQTKTYQDKTMSEDLEITGVLGNIVTMDGKVVVHAHGTFGKDTYEIIGGHVKELIVSATCEVILTKLEGFIEREYDEVTGLNLMK